MALNELEKRRVEKAVGAFIEKHRPPPHIRPELDLGFRVSGQSVEIFEIRPRGDPPQDMREIPVAKATYVKSGKAWKIFWKRADLKWHAYQPVPEVATLDGFLTVVAEDRHACFFG